MTVAKSPKRLPCPLDLSRRIIARKVDFFTQNLFPKKYPINTTVFIGYSDIAVPSQQNKTLLHSTRNSCIPHAATTPNLFFIHDRE